MAADWIVIPRCLSSSMESMTAPTPSLPFTWTGTQKFRVFLYPKKEIFTEMEPDNKVNIHNWWVSPYFNCIISKANDGFPVSAAMFVFPHQQLPSTRGQPPVSSVLSSASFSQPTNRDSGTRPFGSSTGTLEAQKVRVQLFKYTL